MSSNKDRKRDYAASLGLSLAVLAGELPAAASGSANPWIKVTPRGVAKTRDGRSYNFDPEKLVARFQSDQVDLPADFDHSIALTAIRGVKTPAIGWATDLQARPDGTYAQMDWLPEGKSAIAARTHRYISPTIQHDVDGNATWLHSIALTTAPALTMPALAAALVPSSEGVASLAALSVALGLPDGTDLAAVLKAASDVLASSVPKAAHEATLAALTAANEQIAGLTAESRKAEVEAAIDEALRERKIVPAQREYYAAMCATPAGLDTFRGLMRASMPGLQPSGLDGRAPPGAARAAANPRDLSARASAYREQQRAAGFHISHSEAVRAVEGG